MGSSGPTLQNEHHRQSIVRHTVAMGNCIRNSPPDKHRNQACENGRRRRESGSLEIDEASITYEFSKMYRDWSGSMSDKRVQSNYVEVEMIALLFGFVYIKWHRDGIGVSMLCHDIKIR